MSVLLCFKALLQRQFLCWKRLNFSSLSTFSFLSVLKKCLLAGLPYYVTGAYVATMHCTQERQGLFTKFNLMRRWSLCRPVMIHVARQIFPVRFTYMSASKIKYQYVHLHFQKSPSLHYHDVCSGSFAFLYCASL